MPHSKLLLSHVHGISEEDKNKLLADIDRELKVAYRNGYHAGRSRKTKHENDQDRRAWVEAQILKLTDRLNYVKDDEEYGLIRAEISKLKQELREYKGEELSGSGIEEKT